MTLLGSFDEIMPTSFNTEETIMASALSETPVRSQTRANDGKFNLLLFDAGVTIWSGVSKD